MLLRHLHLPGLTQYSQAARLQNKLVSNFLAHKARPTEVLLPTPTVITAEFHPVYTCGRREVGSVTKQQIDVLTAPTAAGQAGFFEALRGGQTTFHGPGQLVAYPILDLKRHNLTPRSYVCLLEKSIIQVCMRDFDIPAFTTENPGVWTNDVRKICALGVHLRRNISSHGIGFNVDTDLRWFDRIVACGLEGKMATSLAREGADKPTVRDVAGKFVSRFSERLHGVDGIQEIGEYHLDLLTE